MSSLTCSSDSQKNADHRSVRWIIDSILAKQIHPMANSVIPSTPVWLWGEVIETKTNDHKRFLKLLDKNGDGKFIEANLPLECEVPDIGHMICIEGVIDLVLDPPAIKVCFNGQRIAEDKGFSNRVNAQNREILQLKLEFPHPVSIERPFSSLALVTSQRSKAVGDFKKGIGRAWVKIRGVWVNLSSADSIAQGIREAGKRPDVDLVVVTRGGDGAQNLLPFNTTVVARAIAEVTQYRPVLVAVGHADDHVLADKFASHSEATPSLAGQFLSELFRKFRSEKRATVHRAGEPVVRDHSIKTRSCAFMKSVWLYTFTVFLICFLVSVGWGARIVWERFHAWKEHRSSLMPGTSTSPPTMVPTGKRLKESSGSRREPAGNAAGSEPAGRRNESSLPPRN